jgi:hypothetical protein
MANKSTADVILAIRQHSNTVNRKVVTDAEVLDRANEGLWELYDLIDGAHGTYFVKPNLFSLVGGYGAYKAPLPTDFYRAKALERSPDTSAMCSIDPLPSFAERNNTRKRCYDLEDVGNISLYPPSQAQGDYRLLYIPKCPQLGAPIVVKSTNPASPLASPLPITSRAFQPVVVVTGVPQGNIRSNQADILAKVESAILGLGAWTIIRSSNGVTITNTNQWTNAAALILGAWIHSKNTLTGVERVTQISVAGGWTEMLTTLSPSVGFTGGTPTVAPTAADQFQVTSAVGGDWLGSFTSDGNTNPQFSAYVWSSVDGAKTRVAWFYTNLAGVTRQKAFWIFDTIGGPVGGAWVPFVGCQWDNGNDMAATARFTDGSLTTILKIRSNTGTAESLFTSTENDGAGVITDRFPQNQQSLQYLWIQGFGMSVSGVAPPRNGTVGYLTDQWLVGAVAGVPVFNDGDTAGAGRFIFLGQHMFGYDGPMPPPGFPAAVDHAEANFYGRSTV